MKRKKFLGFLASFLTLVLVLTGCTGSTLNFQQQWTLSDLYFAGMGLYVHSRAGQFLADQLNTPIPGSRKRADVTAEYVDWRTRSYLQEVYEI